MAEAYEPWSAGLFHQGRAGRDRTEAARCTNKRLKGGSAGSAKLNDVNRAAIREANQVADRLGNVVWGHQGRAVKVGPSVTRHVSVHPAREHRAGPDAVGLLFCGEGLGKAKNGMFASCVRGLVWVSARADDRADNDDAPILSRSHKAQSLTRADGRAAHVDGKG